MNSLLELHELTKHSSSKPCRHPEGKELGRTLHKEYSDCQQFPLSVLPQKLAQVVASAFSIQNTKTHNGKQYFYHAYAGSGNLHTCEVYILSDHGQLYHYNPIAHCLALRHHGDLTNQPYEYTIFITAVVDRQSACYGDRGFRYALLDLGHALGALLYSTSQLDFRLHIDFLSDERLASLLNLASERESDLSIGTEIGIKITLSSEFTVLNKESPSCSAWLGNLIPSSLQTFHWDLSRLFISKTNQLNLALPSFKSTLVLANGLRYSARDFGTEKQGIDLQILHQYFERNLQYFANLFDNELFIKCMLVVNKVEGLSPGIYAVEISYPSSSLRAHFELIKLQECRDDLYYLSCFQECCRDCDCLLIFLSQLGEVPDNSFYRQIHYMIGLLSHIFQVEGLKYNIRSRPIGAFFDDDLVTMLGLDPLIYNAIQIMALGL